MSGHVYASFDSCAAGVREIKNGLYKEYTETTAVIYCSRQARVALYGQKILTGAVLLPD